MKFIKQFILPLVTAAVALPLAAQSPASDESPDDHCFAVRANLLRWATLTPDVGVEWYMNNRISFVAHGTYTSWSWNDKERRYALWEVQPEVRMHFGKDYLWHVGAFYKYGWFNYKFSHTGKQGYTQGCGLTAGWELPLNRALSLDFTAGLGFFHDHGEKYVVEDGVRVRTDRFRKDWSNPVQLGVTLVWTLE